jgi:hypothetical protein
MKNSLQVKYILHPKAGLNGIQAMEEFVNFFQDNINGFFCLPCIVRRLV